MKWPLIVLAMAVVILTGCNRTNYEDVLLEYEETVNELEEALQTFAPVVPIWNRAIEQMDTLELMSETTETTMAQNRRFRESVEKHLQLRYVMEGRNMRFEGFP